MRIQPYLRSLPAASLLAAMLLSGCSGETEKQPPPDAQARAEPADHGPLRRGIPLPAVPVLGPDGETTDIRSLVDGKDTIVFFVSTSCDVCKEMLGNWTSDDVWIPGYLNLFAVVDDDPEHARIFAETENVPFPVYADTRSILSREWSVDEYPTVAGVAPDGFVVYARKGVVPELFTVARAETLLARGKRYYGKAGQ